MFQMAHRQTKLERLAEGRFPYWVALLVVLEPIEKNGLADVTAGSSCIVNAYTSNHEVIASKDTGTLKAIGLHAIDTVGLVHAMLLRIQALLLPIKTLVLSGH
jgi:hypothetical protein